MGNENITKDSNIQIFLQLRSLLIKTGQKVKGCVYLAAKEYALYSELILRIQCFQRTQSSTLKDKNKQPLVQQKTTYLQQITIYQFLNGLYQGNHQFPFNFILPQGLPGSLFFSACNYIRYRVTAYIQSSQPNMSNQLHSKQIWIEEKFRGLIEPIFSRRNHLAHCCMWGFSYGNILSQIQCESNCVNAGQKFKIRFKVNTNKMNTSIKLATIKLLQKNVIIAHNNKEEKQVNQLFSFDFNQISIKKGQTRQIQKYIQLPIDIYSTAIGQNIAKFYIIKAQFILSCFSRVCQTIHIFVNSKMNGLKQQNKLFVKPRKWKVLKYKTVQFGQLKKYKYEPNENIAFHNRKKQEGQKLQSMKLDYPMSSRKLIL